MSQKIAVIDYGMGNLRSVSKAVEHVAPDAAVRVTDDPAFISAADRVVFPGQGAARDCMAAISQHHVNKAVREAAAGKPFLGICMGLQVLMNFSEENDGTQLMGLFPGVTGLPPTPGTQPAPATAPRWSSPWPRPRSPAPISGRWTPAA